MSEASIADIRRDMGAVGVWATELRFADKGFIVEAAAELEELGYGTLWFPGGHGGEVLETIDMLLGATSRAVIATGILNIWMHEPADIGAWWHALALAQQARVMLGLGVGHASAIGEAWRKPLQKMDNYLTGLDGADIPEAHRCLAALGPRMLDLARDRSAGAHPYLVTPKHTALARERLGPAALLAPEQGVILDSDPASARRKARDQLAMYIERPNYRNSWLRQGFSEDDLNSLSDHLIDAIFVWGSPETIAERIKAHRDAGADHVCMQVVGGATGSTPPEVLRQHWRDLAAATLGR
jgi:probable F420-dependent oxidoreductase